MTDPRSSEQKYQSEQAIGRDARLADAMEKARLKQEEKDLAANTPKNKPLIKPASATTPKNLSTRRTKAKKKAGESAYFVAQLPGDKKKKPTSRTSTPSKDVKKL